jgi:Na+/melibiose symporter-like transporter
VSPAPRDSTLAPFRQRSFRFQWPSDLATSWAFEMETLILGWYVLTETGSVVLLSLFGALQLLGTLISPLFGVAGDRVGHRLVLCAMRITYAVLAAILTVLALTDSLSPAAVFAVTALAGLVRPSDMGMRNALIGATMPPPLLMGALSIERTSADSAKIVGALSGAALVAALGTGRAYLVVTALYLLSFALTLGVQERIARRAGGSVTSPWRELADGVAYVRTTPSLLAAIALAFLLNFAAYPMSQGLMPYVAREVYGTDRTGLSYLLASFAGGGLAGSVLLSARGGVVPPARTMLVAAALWFALLLVFARVEVAALGMALLALAGFVQSFAMVPLAAVLLRVGNPLFRGRVMGLRMLAVYGLPVGLLVAGPLIAAIGFPGSATLYAGFGLASTAAIALFWRRHLWPLDAPANARQG